MIDIIPLLQAPFVVSITGHVDPDEPEELSRIIEQQLRAIRAEAESQGPKPQHFLLLSALAKGADTLAAREAIQLGWEVIAPLPLPLEEYRDGVYGFKGAELEEFNELSGQCKHFFIGYAPGGNAENTSVEGDFLDRQYAYLGEFLTRHCEVLIACWDGDVAAGTGGTGDVVELQLRGIPQHLLELRASGALLDPPEGGRVIQILTKRSKAPEKAARPFEDGGFYSVQRGQEANVYEIKRRPDEKKAKRGQNVEVKRFQQRRKHWQEFVDITQAKREWKDPYNNLPQDYARNSPYLTAVREAFIRSDALARELQEEIKRSYNLILALSLGVTVSVSIAGAWNKSAFSTLLLVLTWAFLLLAISIVRREKESGRNTRFQDYRALAEAFRVLFFWRAVGIHEPLDTFYLRYQRSELDWIRGALRVADLQWRAQFGYPDVGNDALMLTRLRWVKHQYKYFDKQFPKNRMKLTTLRNWSWAFLLVGLSASAIGALATLNIAQALNDGIALGVWRFATSFASAELLASPFLPAVLLLSRMEKWPLATDDNTRNTDAPQPATRRKLRELRQWFVYQDTIRRLASVALALVVVGAGAAVLVNLIPATPLVPYLQLAATLCFFSPLLIWLYAEFQGFAENAERYEQTFQIFERARELLVCVLKSKPKNEKLAEKHKEEQRERAQRVLHELGREALQENGEWLLTHRRHELELGT